jgi:hypothetical protein
VNHLFRVEKHLHSVGILFDGGENAEQEHPAVAAVAVAREELIEFDCYVFAEFLRDILLAFKIAVEGGARNARFFGDIGYCDFFKRLFREQQNKRRYNALPRDFFRLLVGEFKQFLVLKISDGIHCFPHFSPVCLPGCPRLQM